jgi:CubicO group peptidase (beta-lactamase class C family)
MKGLLRIARVLSLPIVLGACSSGTERRNSWDEYGAPTLEPPADSSAPVDSPSQAKALAVDDQIRATMQLGRTPGIQAAVVNSDGVVWSKAYGSAVLAPLPEVATTEDTIFIGTPMSMMVVPIAIMQQVEAGVIDLDDDVATVLPWPLRNPAFPDDPITWRMLLTQTSSINDLDDPLNVYFHGQDSPVSLADFMSDVFSPTGVYHGAGTFLPERPGVARQYSNFAVGLAAYALELVVGQPFHEYLRERVLEPLGMNRTSYFLADLPTELLAVPYECDLVCSSPSTGGSVLEQQYSHPNYPDGLLRTSAKEFGKLFVMLLNGGRAGETAVLQPASVEELLTPQPVPGASELKQGLIFVSFGNETSWGHFGNAPGAIAAAFVDRTTGQGAIILGNGPNSNPTPNNQLLPVVRRLLEEFR